MSRSARALRLIRDLDELFEMVVQHPHEWDENRFRQWAEQRLEDGEPLPREASRLVGQGLRRAQRLQRYWAKSDGPAGNWEMAVDEALGTAGWRPGLDLARWGLEHDPDPELYDEYARRFQAVKFQPPSERYEDFL